MADLATKSCKACDGETETLSTEQIDRLLKDVPGWSKSGDGKWISRKFSFENYHHTIAFVNASAWISHREGHHPDLEVGFGHVLVKYQTHAVGGLTENDFICAAKHNDLVEGDMADNQPKG